MMIEERYEGGQEESDVENAARAGAGDIEALSVLIERHRLALFRTAFAELRRYDDAQDAVAEAIVRACRWAAYHKAPVRNFLPWMHRVVRNEARRLRLRREGRRETSIDELELRAPSDLLDRGGEIDLALEVREALRRLPTEQARVMALFYIDGLSVAAIAVALTRPVGTVKWILSRGRANLAPLLEGHGAVKGLQGPQMGQSKGSTVAVLAAPALSPEQQRELADALVAAGWHSVRVVTQPDDLLRFTRPDRGGAFALPPALDGCGFVVIDEQIGGKTSAFELLPLLAAAQRRNDFALMLLLDTGRGQQGTDAATLSAYISGVDFLLTKPCVIAEFTSFATQAHKRDGQ